MKIWIIFLVLLIIPIVNAQDFEFERNSNSTLLFTCKDDFTGKPCATNYLCNISFIDFPNGARLSGAVALTRNGDTYEHNLTNISVNGNYPYSGFCTNGTTSSNADDLSFLVSETGRTFSTGQSLAGFGIIFVMIALSFFFLFLGFKFSGNPKTLPLTLFFVIVGIFFTLYSVQLTLNFSVDVLQNDDITSLTQSYYIFFIYSLQFVGLVSGILMVIGFVREFGKSKTFTDFGENFDPITETYK